MEGTSTKMLASLVGRELLSSFVQKIETISEKKFVILYFSNNKY